MTTQEKTEKPTGKKLHHARMRGQIAKSRDLTTVCVLITGCLSIYLTREMFVRNFRQLVEFLWAANHFRNQGDFGDLGVSSHLFTSLLVLIAPVTLTILITAVIVNLVQMKGFLFSFQALRISFANLNPVAGLRRLVSLRSLMEFVKSIFKMAIVSYAVYSVLWPERENLSELTAGDINNFLTITGMLALKIVLRVAGCMMILSLLDFLYQRWQTRKDLMMTRQEVKEEAKQSEGNPQIRARIRSIQRAIMRQRMISRIPRASVIITNPTHFAVALLYKPGMEAPTVVAKGADFLAQKIISIGRKHGVPIIQNPPLARALYKQVKLEEIIPVELYRAVAKILAYIYQQKQALGRTNNG